MTNALRNLMARRATPAPVAMIDHPVDALPPLGDRAARQSLERALADYRAQFAHHQRAADAAKRKASDVARYLGGF